MSGRQPLPTQRSHARPALALTHTHCAWQDAWAGVHTLCCAPQAYAARANTRLAFKYYKQLRRQKFDVLATRPMFELLIEGMLRRRNVKLALQVGGRGQSQG